MYVKRNVPINLNDDHFNISFINSIISTAIISKIIGFKRSTWSKTCTQLIKLDFRIRFHPNTPDQNILPTLVRVEFLNGMCAFPVQISLMQFPRAKRPRLMLLASARRSPLAWVFRTDSEPAKSTKLILASWRSPLPLSRNSSIRKTAWDLKNRHSYP